MWRSILAVILGIVAGGITVGIVEVPGFLFLHPPPAGFDWENSEHMLAHAAKAPFSAHLLVAVAWALGPLVGGLVSALIAARAPLVHALIVGGLFLLADVSNYYLPHPLWLMVAGVVLPPLTALMGGVLAQRFKTRHNGSPKPYDMREKNMAC